MIKSECNAPSESCHLCIVNGQPCMTALYSAAAAFILLVLTCVIGIRVLRNLGGNVVHIVNAI